MTEFEKYLIETESKKYRMMVIFEKDAAAHKSMVKPKRSEVATTKNLLKQYTSEWTQIREVIRAYEKATGKNLEA